MEQQFIQDYKTAFPASLSVCAPSKNSDQSVHSPEDTLHPLLPTQCPVLIRLRRCVGLSESSLDAHLVF